MAEEMEIKEAGRGRRFLKWAGIIVGILAILVVAGYFVGTSSAFVKGVILPRAGKSLNCLVDQPVIFEREIVL